MTARIVPRGSNIGICARSLPLILLLGAAGCVPAASGGGTATTPAPTRVWPILTRSHVDLWLHGYAMLLRDTSTVPVFRRDYRDRVQAVKTRRNIATLLDANRERLQARLALSPALANGQFAPLYFGSFDQMRQVIQLFLQAEGNPRAAPDQTMAQYFAVLAQSFGTAADREWLRLYTESLEDERRKFYQEYWTSENGAHLALVQRADSLWQNTYRPRLQRFLNNTQQENGEIILALTLGGEGRTVNFSSRQNAVAATMPQTDPLEGIYVFVHEITSSIVSTAVNDNTTPADQRAGVASRYMIRGTVRAGAELLRRTAPELVAGYTRYYLSQAGQSTTGDIQARLASVFSLPDVIRAAIERQIEVVLGGI